VTEENFKALVEEHMEKHGLIQTGWAWKYTRRDSRSSKCCYQTKTLALAPYLLCENKDDVLGILLHEIAHAISTERGHGKEFRAKCREIGVPQNYIYSRSKKRRIPAGERKYSPYIPSPGKWETFKKVIRQFF
jgi:predicted SprT family Zn-dependent metalloprotease